MLKSNLITVFVITYANFKNTFESGFGIQKYSFSIKFQIRILDKRLLKKAVSHSKRYTTVALSLKQDSNKCLSTAREKF